MEENEKFSSYNKREMLVEIKSPSLKAPTPLLETTIEILEKNELRYFHKDLGNDCLVPKQ